MEKPTLPENEEERLNALLEYEVMDTLPEDDYDNITRIASQICNTPISLITLIDDRRQWFKSRQGMDSEETPREVSFCAHGILNQHEPFIVRNSLEDVRFKDNPLVTGAPHVEFYAGIPLINPDGFALGSLCVIDNHPRDISEQQLNTLQSLAKQVVKLLELRKTVLQLERAEKQLKVTNNDLKEFAFLVSHDIKSPLSNLKMLSEMILENPTLQIDVEGKQCLDMMSRSAQQAINFVDDVLNYSKSIHFLVENKKIINLAELLPVLVKELTPPAQIEVQFTTELGHIYSSPVAIKQIFSNLIGNAIKYNDKAKGVIEISMQEHPKHYQFQISDNGKGIPGNQLEGIFSLFYRVNREIQSEKSSGIGLAIVKKLIDRLGGEIKVNSVLGEGTTFDFSIKK